MKKFKSPQLYLYRHRLPLAFVTSTGARLPPLGIAMADAEGATTTAEPSDISISAMDLWTSDFHPSGILT